MASMPQRRTQPPDAELTVKRVLIRDLKPDPDNERVHGALNLDAIEHSLRRFGQRKPLVVTEDMVVAAGNGTLEVLRWRMGRQYVWVTVFPGTHEEARAYAVADNRPGDFREWDERILAETLKLLDSDLQLAAGFRPDDVRLLLESIGEQAANAGRNQSKHGPTQFAGQTPGAGLAAQADLYGDKATRTLYFEFDKAVFDWLVGVIGRFREARDLPSNGEALAAMVGEVTGTSPEAG